MTTTTTTATDFPARYYSAAQVAEITGLSAWCINEACREGNIRGAFKRKPTTGSPWVIPGQGAQRYFDEIRGIRRQGL